MSWGPAGSGETYGKDVVVLLLLQSLVAVVVEELVPGGALDGTQQQGQRAQAQRGHARGELPRVADHRGLLWWGVITGSEMELKTSRMFSPYLGWCPGGWSGGGVRRAEGGPQLLVAARLSCCVSASRRREQRA